MLILGNDALDRNGRVCRQFGVQPTDAPTFALVTVILLGVSIAASYVPARRATLIDPIDSLHAS